MEGEVKEGEPHRTGSGDGDINASVRSPRAPQPSLPPIISSSLSLEALPPFPSFTLPPSFASSSTLLKQGAEGRVFLSTFLSRPCVVKQRFPKTYRHPSLDLSLTRARLNAECRSLLKVRRARRRHTHHLLGQRRRAPHRHGAHTRMHRARVDAEGGAEGAGRRRRMRSVG